MPPHDVTDTIDASTKKIMDGGLGSGKKTKVVDSSDEETICQNLSPVLARIGDVGLKKRKSQEVTVIDLDDGDVKKNGNDKITVKLKIHEFLRNFVPVKSTSANPFEAYAATDDSDIEIMDSIFGENAMDPQNAVNLPSQNKEELESCEACTSNREVKKIVKNLKDNSSQSGVNLSPSRSTKQLESEKINDELLSNIPTTSSASNKNLHEIDGGIGSSNRNQNHSVDLETFGFVCANLLAASAKKSQDKLEKTMLKHSARRLDLKNGNEEGFRNLIQMSKEFTRIINKRDTLFINPLLRSKRKRSCASTAENNSEETETEIANRKDLENSDSESQSSSGTDKKVLIISDVLLNDGKRKACDLSPENVKKPRNVSYDLTRTTEQDTDEGVWFPKFIDLTEDEEPRPISPEWINTDEPRRKRCFFCGKEVFNLKLHIYSHHTTAKEMCEVCGKTYKMKAHKTQHIIRSHYDYYFQKLTENQK